MSTPVTRPPTAAGAPAIGIVVPCYNEEEVLPETASRLGALLDRLMAAGSVSRASCVYFVDDGSRDGTWPLIERLHEANPALRGIKLSRNRGHQNALLAGLLTAEGDALVSVDADLQDDLGIIEGMVDRFRSGTDIVFGVRDVRRTDTWFKRSSAAGFYALMSWLGADPIRNHADFRLMSRRSIEALREFREVNLFLRGLVPLIGFRSAVLYYERTSRFAGESKYPFRRMLAFALEGITSFSVVPLRMITYLGFAIFVLTMAMTGWVLWSRLFTTNAIPGWASTVLPMYFLGGIQVFCIGMLGEYLGKIYREVKSRPRYFIEQVL